MALSFAVHIFTDNYLVLSQYTRLTDGRTDRQTDRQTDRMSIAIPCVATQSHGKNGVAGRKCAAKFVCVKLSAAKL